MVFDDSVDHGRHLGIPYEVSQWSGLLYTGASKRTNWIYNQVEDLLVRTESKYMIVGLA